MKIERIDDKTVKCYLSHEELEEYDIDYKDFLMRSEKAKEMVKVIIEQAEETVGYKPPEFAFDLQIMALPDQGLILTFSEKDPADLKDGTQLMEYLQEMKQALQQTKEQIHAQAAGATTKEADTKEVHRPKEAIFQFDSLGRVMEYAGVLPGNLRVHSELYVMDGSYYLYIAKNAASYQRYSRICIQAMEFGTVYAAAEEKISYLREHGECLIADHVFKKLTL